MKPIFICVLLCVASAAAHADVFQILAGFVCDTQNDQLVLTYDGTYTENGKAPGNYRQTAQWDPWTLVTVNNHDLVVATKTVHRQCKLSDGVYGISVFPVPGNYNTQGSCGAVMAAGMKVKRGKRLVYSINSFEGECHDADKPVTTRVIIRPKVKEPEVMTVNHDDFYQ